MRARRPRSGKWWNNRTYKIVTGSLSDLLFRTGLTSALITFSSVSGITGLISGGLLFLLFLVIVAVRRSVTVAAPACHRQLLKSDQHVSLRSREPVSSQPF